MTPELPYRHHFLSALSETMPAKTHKTPRSWTVIYKAVLTSLQALFLGIATFGNSVAFALQDATRPRLSELGIHVGILQPGPLNAITDVAGVEVGHCSVIEGDSIRTGVTAIRPHGNNVFLEKVPAAIHVANGYGKFVGSTQVDELGVLETPIVLTNTLSTFEAADAVVRWTLKQPGCESVVSVNPVVGECNDSYLNDIRQLVITADHVWAALDDAKAGTMLEGCVGAGVGVQCLGWKGGIGTASRQLPERHGAYLVGVLVQTNFGGSLVVAGVPIPRDFSLRLAQDLESETVSDGDVTDIVEHGSCIIVVATDAPLDARQLKRLAGRAPLALGAVGSPISHGSGDYVLAFSTAEDIRTSNFRSEALEQKTLLRDDAMTPLFQAVREATEEAILNSLLQAETTTGLQAREVPAIDPEQLRLYWHQQRTRESSPRIQENN